MRRFRTILSLLSWSGVLFGWTSSTLAGGGGRSAFELVSRDQDGWTYQYAPRQIAVSTILIDGQPHLLFDGEAGSIEELEGTPQLPREVLSLGIPTGGSLMVDILSPEYERQENVLVAPHPFYTFNAQNEGIAEYRKNVRAYGRNEFAPAEHLEVERPVQLRQQRIATVRIHPYQYNPATQTLRRLVRASVKIRLVPAEEDSYRPAPPESDPGFEEVYRSLLHNYEEAKQWRVLPVVTQDGPDPTRDWFETGRAYYRIRIAQDGWYRVTKSDLAAAGANTSTIDLPSLRVYGRGLQIPLVIRPDTSFEFHALRNYGDSTFIDFFTDTASYWITWGGEAGARFVSTPMPTGTPGMDLGSAQTLRHFEQNNWYYTGLGESEVINIETVAGEGWAWGTPPEWFFPNLPRTYTFALDSIDGAAGTAALKVRLFSTTADSPAVDHHARFWVNDSLAGEVMFEGRQAGMFAASLSAPWLRNGNNVLRILSLPTPSFPNQFYLDWFEVEYPRLLRASGDVLTFRSPPTSGGSPAQFTVAGFSSPAIEVFELSTNRQITGGSVSGNATVGYTIVFRDTFSTARTYVVVGAAGARSVLPLQARMFSDIRVNPAGADYIIVTHRNFLTPAQQLAAHRQHVNGVRVKIIDVQDIYDEFNYGVSNATKLKTFLRHAYLSWPSPAPAYVLFLGDASWDYHRYLPTTVKTNYVPAFGVPATDNWYVSFSPDTTFLPWMLVGRIPAEDSVRALATIRKISRYDHYKLAGWNKNFMFITGGDSPTQQNQFNALSNSVINTFVTPPPIGGTPLRVYKSTPFVIDGENRELMQDHFRTGLLFVNFLGHSGGRIWNVDIGSPDLLENTTGKLPFVSSVSCNVGAFAEPSSNVLAEDFLMADNRGAIASWASSSVGYQTLGVSLVQYLLRQVKDEGVRGMGALTTTARIRLWLERGSTARVIAMVHLNPLIGDPLSRLALPYEPDLAISRDDIRITPPSPTVNDSVVRVHLTIRNFGLVPADSVVLRVTDTYNGHVLTLLDNVKIPPTLHRDSLQFTWDSTYQIGRHALVAALDPSNTIPETNEFNNTVSQEVYFYANQLAVVKPLDNQVVPGGMQTLVVTSPIGRDTAGFWYEYDLDTVATFDSPALMSSGPVVPGPVSGQWQTPSLAGGSIYFWRVRTVEGSTLGRWVVSSFSTSTDLPPAPLVRLRENSPRQFQRDGLVGASPTDSGVTIAPNVPVNLLARSVGTRFNPDQDYYSILRIGNQTISGLPWILASGFMGIRLDDLTGTFEFKHFPTGTSPVFADSMRRFILNTPVGDYLAFSVINDGRTNVSESLYVALEQQLGSTLIRTVQPTHAWVLIARRGAAGPGMTPLESVSATGEALVSTQLPTNYFGGGSVTTGSIPIAVNWSELHWRRELQPATNLRLAMLGVRSNGVMDTLRILPADSTDVNLGFLNPLTAGPTYTSFRHAALLSTSEGAVTPVFKEWWMDFEPPPDLAVSARTIGLTDAVIQKGSVLNLPVTVHNIGFRGADSARIVVSLFDRYNKARPVASAQLDTIPVGGSKSTIIPITTVEFPRRATLEVRVSPSKKGKDLVADNNVAYTTVMVTGSTKSGLQLFADGVQLMDGDYVSTRPTLVVRVPDRDVVLHLRRAELLVNGLPMSTTSRGLLSGRLRSERLSSDDLSFTPELSDGQHELKVRIVEVTPSGEIDSLEHAVLVNVLRESRIVQLFNYPNPFRDDTQFTFMLTGTRPPQELVIRIYTVSGRKIREIPVRSDQLRIGFNRVPWDGRDEDGDEIANGYYLYQVSLLGDGRRESAVEKLVKLR